MWENVQRRIEGPLSQEGMRLRGEPGSTSKVLWSKDDAYAGCLVQSTLDVCVGWDLESPHLEEASQTLQNLP